METLTLEQVYFLSEIIGVIAVVISLVKIIFNVPFIYRQQAGFTMNQNSCSRKTGMGVHDVPE